MRKRENNWRHKCSVPPPAFLAEMMWQMTRQKGESKENEDTFKQPSSDQWLFPAVEENNPEVTLKILLPEPKLVGREKRQISHTKDFQINHEDTVPPPQGGRAHCSPFNCGLCTVTAYKGRRRATYSGEASAQAGDRAQLDVRNTREPSLLSLPLLFHSKTVLILEVYFYKRTTHKTKHKTKY